ncbi:hypothetical protein B0H14DRAFT_2504825 [Mycena olivaceomarginata]|nr:hypothetical protein B0H14DRAFT_2504825 [Mycena olivaceomarginata]
MSTLPNIIAANAAWAPAYTPVGIFVGGTSGIGQGIAEAFARHTNGRAHIVLVGRNEAAAAAILARLPAASSGEVYTREFISCDLALVANAKRTSAQLAARFPRVNILFLTAGAISLKGFDPTPEEGIDRQMASLYYSKWAFIDGLLPSLRAAREAGEDARVAAVHTAGRGIPVDLEDLGLEKGLQRGVRGARSLVGQLASYQDLMAEAFGAHDPTLTFTHTFPGSVDTPVLRASPSLALRIAHYVRLVLRIRGEMTIEECGERQLWGLLQVRVCIFSALSRTLFLSSRFRSRSLFRESNFLSFHPWSSHLLPPSFPFWHIHLFQNLFSSYSELACTRTSLPPGRLLYCYKSVSFPTLAFLASDCIVPSFSAYDFPYFLSLPSSALPNLPSVSLPPCLPAFLRGSTSRRALFPSFDPLPSGVFFVLAILFCSGLE